MNWKNAENKRFTQWKKNGEYVAELNAAYSRDGLAKNNFSRHFNTDQVVSYKRPTPKKKAVQVSAEEQKEIDDLRAKIMEITGSFCRGKYSQNLSWLKKKLQELLAKKAKQKAKANARFKPKPKAKPKAKPKPKP